MHHTPQISRRELNQELANSLSHGFGILFGIVSIPILIATAAKTGNVALLTGAGVYGFSFMMVFTFSTLYHGFQQPTVKHVLHILDHISIYFLIAGSYTPFILAFLYNPTGIALLCTLWGLALLGTLFKVFFVKRFNLASTFVYLAMGWMLLTVSNTFFANMPPAVIWLIAAGGASYTVGVVFYLWKKMTYHHLVWHLFVLAGGICHYVAVLHTVS